jgi:hypothetical protein
MHASPEAKDEKWWRELDLNQRRHKPADLQSAPFSHSGIPPGSSLYTKIGAGEGTRTPNLLITNQLLYQLSYTSNITLRQTHFSSGKGKVSQKKVTSYFQFVA